MVASGLEVLIANEDRPSLMGRWPRAPPQARFGRCRTRLRYQRFAGLDLEIETGDGLPTLVVLGKEPSDLERHAASGAVVRAADGRTTASPIIIAAISRVETATTLRRRHSRRLGALKSSRKPRPRETYG